VVVATSVFSESGMLALAAQQKSAASQAGVR
jgi:hypothetical protein